jgi:hypothetical protein
MVNLVTPDRTLPAGLSVPGVEPPRERRSEMIER